MMLTWILPRRPVAVRGLKLLLLMVAVAVGWSAAVAREQGPVKSLLEMRQKDVVIQQWDLSCGAAALATLLKFQYGKSVSEHEIAVALMKREEYLKNPGLVRAREGFSLLDLKRYVESQGYQGVGLGKLELDDLVKRAPIMVAVNLHGYNHFVIFRGMVGDRVLIADPAWGNRTLLKKVFLNAWIDYPTIGRTGFMVRPAKVGMVNNKSEYGVEDFVFLR